MNILIFSPFRLNPDLDSGSRKRIYNVGKYFQSEGHLVHFVYYMDNGIDLRSFQFMQNEWDTFTVIEQNDVKDRHPGNYKLDERYETHISEIVNSLVSKFHIDLVWTNYIFQSAFLEALPKNVYKIIDTLDVFTDRYQLFENTQDTVYTWYSYSREDEAKGISRADLIVAITEKEKKYFESITDTDVAVIGHLEQAHFFDRDYKSINKIGFIGGANDVNIVSINNFLKEFYRKSRFKDQLQIVVAGWVCNSIKVEHDNLQLLGLVENIEDFYRKVDLVINPLTFGTGQKIKSVEALSFGVPIVSTDIGFEGIESSEAYHHLANIDKMIEAIDEIVEHPKRLNELAQMSQEIFHDYEQSVYSEISEVLEKLPKSNAQNYVSDNDMQEYRLESTNLWVQLLFDHQSKVIEEKGAHSEKKSAWIKKQEKVIEEKYAHSKKQSDWIKKQEKVIEEKTDELEQLKAALQALSAVHFSHHPIKKIKNFKKLMAIYRKLKSI